jgi:hypothetical protein
VTALDALPFGEVADQPTPAQPPARCAALRRDKSGPCGRPLTDATSRARGVGPDCWDRLHPTPAPARTRTEVRTLPRFPVGPDQEELPLDDPEGDLC